MRRLFALVLVLFLWVGFTPSASADLLTPCSETPAYQQRAAKARTEQAKQRFENYSVLQCGPEGLPHLIVDGSLNHAGEFLIPSILFLYIAGWIGWVGRSYLRTVKGGSNPELSEVIIDTSKALPLALSGFLWPLAALKEFTTGDLVAKDEDIPVSPR
ncbi:MAG TPA: Photosystem I reaction center subunit III [Crinalium sp.]|jgi:photosystem I subunit 3